MLRNYFKIAWRNLARNRISSFINIGGLAIGMAVAMLIGLWIWDELSFDTYHQHFDRIAKIRQQIDVNGNIQTEKTVPFPLCGELRNNYGRYFKYIVMSSHRAAHTLSVGEKNLTKNGVYLEPAATEMLTLKMLRGTRAALQDPSSVILSASVARAFFGNADPLNKTMKIDDSLNVKITGVYEDLPFNSTFASVTFIAPFALYVNNDPWIKSLQANWNYSPVQAYVQVADNVSIDRVSAIIKDIQLSKLTKDEAKFKPVIFLDPMSKWHLYADFRNGIRTGGKIQYVWMFGIIGIFVLLLACINFMNLSTARSEKRAREAGIRKVMGSMRAHLVAQFFCESMLVTIFAFICALCLVQVLLPFFNQMAEKKLTVLWTTPWFWFAGIGFCLVTGCIAGSYPAFYLSSFQPVKVLKGSFRVGRQAAIPRQALVVLQFSFSVALIICTIVVFRQIEFTKNRPVGYDRHNLITMPLATNDIRLHLDALKETLAKTGVISSVAESESPITDIWGTSSNLDWKNKDPNLKVNFPNTGVSFEYGKTVGWQFVQGRDFSKQFLSDSTGIVLNEAAAKFMNLTHPVGETIQLNNRPFNVIGVIRNVVTESPYEPVRPSIYNIAGGTNYLFIKINPSAGMADALNKIGTVFRKFSPAAPFNYAFVDEAFAQKFGNEERVGRLASFFAALAVLISCLGLFGLASFVAEQRTKEIGVRKILGATVFDLWRLLSGEFAALVIIALFIAGPLAYYFMHSWLQNYQYRAALSWWIFAVSGAAAMIITLLTVSFQAIKAAVANPVKSLRTE